MPDLETMRTAGLGFAVIGQLGFVALYATFPWWQTFLGRALFFKAVALGAICTFAFFSRLHDWPRDDEVFTTFYWLLGLGIWAQFAAFFIVKKRGAGQ